METANLTHYLDTWSAFSSDKKANTFEQMRVENHAFAEEFFLSLKTPEQAELLLNMPLTSRRLWLRLLPPDDAADLIQELPKEEQQVSIDLLDAQTAKEVSALLAYEEDQAGGLMNSRFFRIRPEMSVNEAIHYLRMQAQKTKEAIYYAYVLDLHQTLLGVVSFRELLVAPSDKTIDSLMKTSIARVPENMDQEEISRLFTQHQLMALPVVDDAGHMVGIVSINDIVDVVKEEATEDIHKIGGISTLDDSYTNSTFFEMIKKRAGWLTILFIGEMFTATAMSFYENEISKAVVLALFIPLIISSGGNSGSQASTLIIRALALKEIRLKDWIKVLWKELLAGLTLGGILGTIGYCRIMLWPSKHRVYGERYDLIAFTIFCSLIGVVLWGVISGAMLPFILKRLGFDPASASAPFVATVVDVTGLIIYFSIASFTLRGILL